MGGRMMTGHFANVLRRFAHETKGVLLMYIPPGGRVLPYKSDGGARRTF